MNSQVTPLSGCKVVEIGTMITAPLAGMMLGDLGAEVIKVERRDGGDPFRNFAGSNYSPHFAAFNRNKRSVFLDFKNDADHAELLDLIKDADVLIENFRPGVMDRLGLSRKVLAEIAPSLVHCSITGFGASGPYAKRPAFDTVGQAVSGIAALSINPAVPKFSGTTVSDNVTGMYACYAILAALMERQQTGKGRHVEVNMIAASAAFMPDAFMNFEMLGLLNGPFTRVGASQAYVLGCADGKLIALHLSSPAKFWQALLNVLGDDAIDRNDSFSTRQGRIQNYAKLSDELQRVFVTRPRKEWIERLSEADVPFAAVNGIDDVLADPELQAICGFREMTLGDGKTVRAIQAPVRFDGQYPTAWTPAPVYEGDAPGSEG